MLGESDQHRAKWQLGHQRVDALRAEKRNRDGGQRDISGHDGRPKKWSVHGNPTIRIATRTSKNPKSTFASLLARTRLRRVHRSDRDPPERKLLSARSRSRARADDLDKRTYEGEAQQTTRWPRPPWSACCWLPPLRLPRWGAKAAEEERRLRPKATGALGRRRRARRKPAADATCRRRAPASARPPPLPQPSRRAFDAGDTSSCSSSATAASTTAGSRRRGQASAGCRGVATFVVPAKQIARYAAITQGAGVDRVPALVVVTPEAGRRGRTQGLGALRLPEPGERRTGGDRRRLQGPDPPLPPVS